GRSSATGSASCTRSAPSPPSTSSPRGIDGAQGPIPMLWAMQRTVAAGITKQIGNTPLLRVRLFEREFPNLEVYAKAEWLNPGGSVRDRPARSTIEGGERR